MVALPADPSRFAQWTICRHDLDVLFLRIYKHGLTGHCRSVLGLTEVRFSNLVVCCAVTPFCLNCKVCFATSAALSNGKITAKLNQSVRRLSFKE